MVVSDLLWLEFEFVGSPNLNEVLLRTSHLRSVFDYTYLLFWNSFWTIAPVIGIGLFDRFAGTCFRSLLSCSLSTLCTDDHLLMDVPELYWFGREGRWFGIGQFIAYMLDGLIQVCNTRISRYTYTRNIEQSAIIYFLITYTYITTSARKDGWQVGLYEFSTVSVTFVLCKFLHSKQIVCRS